MQRLLYITTNISNSGGVSKLLSVKLNYLIEEYDYEIFILNTTGNSKSLFYSFNKKIQIYDLETSRNKLINGIVYRRRLKNSIRKIKPNIIINCDNGLKGALLPYIIGLKEPIIFENHNSKSVVMPTVVSHFKMKIQNLVFSASLKKYKYLVVYKNAKNDWKSNNVTVIPNPLSFKLFKEKTSLENKVAIAVGRLSYQKGYEMLLKIWKMVVDKHPDWMLTIYGEGDKTKFIKIAASLDILNNVNFFRPITGIKNVYLNASMLLNTSRYEPFGLANIEAMAYGLPVFAFNNTLGPSSYIVNNENGFLIKKNDFEAYANKIIYLIENKLEMRRISKNAQESVRQFDIDVIMNQWHRLFQSL